MLVTKFDRIVLILLNKLDIRMRLLGMVDHINPILRSKGNQEFANNLGT